MFKDLTNKLLKVLNFSQNFQTDKVKGAETIVEYSELVVGADVFVSSATGSEAAADGSYSLESGAEIEVKDGKISEIKEEAPVEEEVVAEDLATNEDKPTEEQAPANDKEAELLKEIEDLKAEIAKLKGDFSAIPTKEDLAKFHSDLAAVQAELKEEFKKLENVPAQFSQTDNRVELTDSTEDKYKNLARFYTK